MKVICISTSRGISIDSNDERENASSLIRVNHELDFNQINERDLRFEKGLHGLPQNGPNTTRVTGAFWAAWHCRIEPVWGAQMRSSWSTEPEANVVLVWPNKIEARSGDTSVCLFWSRRPGNCAAEPLRTHSFIPESTWCPVKRFRDQMAAVWSFGSVVDSRQFVSALEGDAVAVTDKNISGTGGEAFGVPTVASPQRGANDGRHRSASASFGAGGVGA
jgi:hypothetical protein